MTMTSMAASLLIWSDVMQTGDGKFWFISDMNRMPTFRTYKNR